jgi:hypothetical protein
MEDSAIPLLQHSNTPTLQHSNTPHRLTVEPEATVTCQESWPLALFRKSPSFSTKELTPKNRTVSWGPDRLTAPAATAYHCFVGS